MNKWFGGFVIALFFVLALALFIGLRSVYSQELCGGKHNIQINGRDLPEFDSGSSETKVFVLPEVGGFKQLYQKFEVKSARAILLCNSPGDCTFYVNNQTCLKGIPSSQKLSQLNCLNLFHDGINTVGFIGNGEIKYIFLETEISSVWC